MRLLILGGDGMLGHRLLRHFQAQEAQHRVHGEGRGAGRRHDVLVTLRRDLPHYAHHNLFTAANAVGGVDARDEGELLSLLASWRPDAVVNAIGIVKQRPDGVVVIPNLEINALFPHKLARLCRATGTRLLHLSTDCVFSGRAGGYSEADTPDAEDVYGRAKLLGEVTGPGCVTLRTSIIGPELGRRQGLVEWFAAQRGTVPGYRQALWSGLTTAVAARAIERVLVTHPRLSGVWHVAADPISKYELLRRLALAMGRDDLRVEPDDALVCDRSLNGKAFEAATGWSAPPWDAQLAELAAELAGRGPAHPASQPPLPAVRSPLS